MTENFFFNIQLIVDIYYICIFIILSILLVYILLSVSTWLIEGTNLRTYQIPLNRSNKNCPHVWFFRANYIKNEGNYTIRVRQDGCMLCGSTREFRTVVPRPRL